MSVSKPSTIPSIMVCAEGLESRARMSIETGASQNLIKQNSMNPRLPIDEKIVLKFK